MWQTRRKLQSPLAKTHEHHHDSHSAEEHWRHTLKHAKLRVTSVRLEILTLLNQTPRAIAAQEVFDALLSASKKNKSAKPDRVTVYRTLTSLVDAGLAHKVDPGDRVFRFSLTDHARCAEGKHEHEHPHFVCDSCGTVECLSDAQVILKPAAQVGTGAGGAGVGKGSTKPSRRKVNQHDVLLHGTCEQCVDEPAKPSKG